MGGALDQRKSGLSWDKNGDSQKHDLHLPAVRSRVGKAHCGTAKALPRLQGTLLGRTRRQAAVRPAALEEEVGAPMPKVELSATLYRRLEALATKTATVEMLVNRAVDDWLRNQ